eukprot:CAMPEP_0196599858 /NCGR_PEP_ID=MMETSP1081-20130531/95081_1 /TAXON_ID=36882 /ORGANISM="Pyramimonas amylifera, Strain CCMP720" /LENGTH=114 /DNA_ID=CAMNT_0041925659 /DNA_START=37 /DNA_END=381 /DNA_ORIENTATION=-
MFYRLSVSKSASLCQPDRISLEPWKFPIGAVILGDPIGDLYGHFATSFNGDPANRFFTGLIDLFEDALTKSFDGISCSLSDLFDTALTGCGEKFSLDEESGVAMLEFLDFSVKD